MPGDYETFEEIYLDLSRVPGRCRFAASGMGWKASPRQGQKETEVWTLPANEFQQAHWSRASKGYEVKVFTRTMGVVQLDGFQQDDLDRVKDTLKSYYNVTMEHREHALKGWNWGKTEFQKHELLFNVAHKPAFEIPYSEVSNLNLAGKAEVAVEFSSAAAEGASSNKKKKNKAAAGSDQLVEMRFYVPGLVKKIDGDGEAGSDKEGEGEEMHAANVFYDTLKEKAEVGEVAGVTYGHFSDVLFLTPRGRYDIDVYENSFRLRGKTYDYKIQYAHIKKIFSLPKPDDVHHMIVVGLEPPLRQGQTRYPFLVMQFKRDDDGETDLSMTEEMLVKYNGKLRLKYDQERYKTVTEVFHGLTGRKIVYPSVQFNSHHNQHGVKCSNKANEGHLFFLDKGLLFVPKPAVYMDLAKVSHVSMSRLAERGGAARTFDITVSMTNGEGEYQFNNINREEQNSLESFMKAKSIRVKNDLIDETALLASIADAMDEDSGDDAPNPDRGSADEDEESVDEDFHAESESDVAEEYDSAHESSGSDDDEDGGSDDDDASVASDDGMDGEIEDVEMPPAPEPAPKKKELVTDGPAKKKVKTAK